MKVSQDLLEHRAEFARYMANKQYEVSDEGIFFPKASAHVTGVYTHDVNGLDERSDPNIVTDEGLAYLLDTGLHSASAFSTWYFRLFSANATPLFSWTGANFTTNATEITSTSEGWTGSLGMEFVEAAAVKAGASSTATASTTNSASKASFTIVTASALTVWGAGLCSNSTRGGTTGTLLSASKFGAARTLYSTDVFNLGYTLSLTSS